MGDGYIVRGVYQMLMRQEMHNYDAVSEAVWHKNVPMKVSICAWRFLRNRLPTKDNLVRHDIIPFNSQFCVSGFSNTKSADHLVIHCPVFGMLWQTC